MTGTASAIWSTRLAVPVLPGSHGEAYICGCGHSHSGTRAHAHMSSSDQPFWDAVDALRRRKGRGSKPFAVMVAEVSEIASVVSPSEHELAALASAQRPIVLLQRAAHADAPDTSWPDSVAPGAADVGVMLPYAPLHHLLFDGLVTRVLVCTSANLTDEQQIEAEDDYRICARRGSDETGKPKTKKRKPKEEA